MYCELVIMWTTTRVEEALLLSERIRDDSNRVEKQKKKKRVENTPTPSVRP